MQELTKYIKNKTLTKLQIEQIFTYFNFSSVFQIVFHSISKTQLNMLHLVDYIPLASEKSPNLYDKYQIFQTFPISMQKKYSFLDTNEIIKEMQKSPNLIYSFPLNFNVFFNTDEITQILKFLSEKNSSKLEQLQKIYDFL